MTMFPMRAALVLIAPFALGATAAAQPVPHMCPMIYAPVCAAPKGAPARTFGNACQAGAARARILHRGPCGRGEVRMRAVVCTMDYRPVCAEKRGVARTYGNACAARAVRARVLHAGECATR